MPQAKPAQPAWQPGHPLARGCKLYLPLTERAEAPRDLVTGSATTVVGAPARAAGPFGAQLGGFTTADYVAIDRRLLATGVYPFWAAFLYAYTGPTGGWIFTQRSSGDSAPVVGLKVAGTTLTYYLRDDASGGPAGAYAVTVAALNNGQPHVLLAVSATANSHQLYFDGLAAAGPNTTALGTTTCNQLNLGVNKYSTTISEAFTGVLGAAAMGTGPAPDPAALAADWLSGRFAAMRPARSLIGLYVPATGPAGAGWMRRLVCCGSD